MRLHLGMCIGGMISALPAAPIAAGAVSDQTYTAGTAISTLNVAADFTGSGITYSLDPSSAALPAGLSLNASTGAITGTPTEAVSRTIVVRGTNGGGYAVTGFDIYVGLDVAAWNDGVSSTSDSTSIAISLPSGMAAGDLVGVIVAVDGTPDIVVNAGSSVGEWHKLRQASNSTVVTSAVFWAMYESGLSLTLTTSDSQQSSHISFRVPHALGLTGGSANGNSTNSDPPSFTHPAGAGNYLVIAAAGRDAQVVASAAPSGYSALHTKTGGGANGASCDAAIKRIWSYGSATEDPGVFTSASEQWTSWTLFVQGTPAPLRFDTSTVTVPSDSLPAYLTPYIDPQIGVRITRISDNGNAITTVGSTWTADARQQYSSLSAWNSDESMLYLEYGATSGRLFLDGETYAPLYRRDTPSGFVEGRWHPTNPQVMLYTTGSALRSWNVVTDATSLVKTWTGYSAVNWRGESEMSDDGNITAMVATRTSDSDTVVIVYRISDDTILGTINVTDLSKAMSDGHAMISPDGDYVHLYFDDETSAIYTAAGSLVYNITATQYPSHADVIKSGGVQYVVGPTRGDADGSGHIVRRLLTADTVVKICSSSYAYHTGSRNRGGDWCVNTYHGDSGLPYAGQITATRIDGARTYRICHHRSTGTSYAHEPHGCASPSGKRVVFGSDWGGGNGGAVHAFVADFRDFALP